MCGESVRPGGGVPGSAWLTSPIQAGELGRREGQEVHLVPIPALSAEARRKKRAEIVRHYNVRGPLLFLHVNLLDNRSEFSAPLEVSLRKEGDDYVAEVFGAIAIANTIAYLSEAIDPNRSSLASPGVA